MRSRGVLWVLACAFSDCTSWRRGENGAIEDPWAIRQGMKRFDLAGLRGQPERFGRNMQKSRGLAEVEPRFDSILSWLVDSDAVMRAQ